MAAWTCRWSQMGPKLIIAVAFSVVAVGCSGSDTSDSAAPAAPPATTATAEAAPAELALADSDVAITGDTGALVVHGETVTMDHLVYNSGSGAASMGFRIRQDEAGAFEPQLSATSVRIKGGEVFLLSTTVTVPDSAELDDVLTYDVVAVNVDEIDQRSTLSVQLLVVDATGSRPTVGANTGVTDTNEKVLVYVIGDDSDPDGDLDYGSLRVIAGGFLAAEITGAGDGTVTYVPFANVTGSDVLLYELCDSEHRCDTAVVAIDVRG
jgi:hypothetical protein